MYEKGQQNLKGTTAIFYQICDKKQCIYWQAEAIYFHAYQINPIPNNQKGNDVKN
jgi:hypothetical protein